MVQKLSWSSSAAVSDFRYDACGEHICLATNLPGLAPGRLAEPGAAADRELIARKWTYPVVSKTQTNSRRTDKLPYSQSDT